MAELKTIDEPNDDLRGDLARAIAGAAEPVADEFPDAPEPVDETPEKPTAEEQRARDEAGRFAKETKKRETLTLKEKPPGNSLPNDPAAIPPAAPAPPKIEIPPPMEWKGEEKLLWKNVPNALKQKYVDSLKAAEERANQSSPLMEAIGKDRDMLVREGGGSVEGGVRRLLELSNFAIANPVDFVRTFIQQRGLNPAQIFGQGNPAGATPPGQPQPQISPELQTLQQRLDAFEARQSQQAHSATLAQIEAFASDPEHVYFNDVSDDMLAFIKDNPAIGLKGAYERAVWSNPAVRAQMLAAQQPSNPANVDAARRAKSANLNGSPVPGSSSQQADPNEDLRATLERNYKASMGGARV